jgi:hypothetical protein
MRRSRYDLPADFDAWKTGNFGDDDAPREDDDTAGGDDE